MSGQWQSVVPHQCQRATARAVLRGAIARMEMSGRSSDKKEVTSTT